MTFHSLHTFWDILEWIRGQTIWDGVSTRISYFRFSSSDYSILSCEQALASILNEDDGASSIEDDRKLPDKCLPNNDK